VGEWAEGCERVGIDAPFGWPAAFVAMMARHHGALGDAAGGSVVGVPEWSPAQRDQLRFRRTDVVVRGALGRWPLSVSSDLIAIVAMRCAGFAGSARGARSVGDESGG
jgi:hypothetical protein